MRKRLISLGLTLAAALALAPAAVAAPTTFTVNNAGDSADASPGNGICLTGTGECTLRAAIQESNATATGAPYRIRFSVAQISVASALPAIVRDGTFVDGCSVGQADPPFDTTPNTPAADPCVGLAGAGAQNGLQVGDVGGDTSGVAVFNLAFTSFPGKALRIWGADRTRVGGNVFGRRLDGSAGPNGIAVNVSGRTQNGTLVNPAIGNLVGGPSNAANEGAPACDDYCNAIVGSTAAGIDLVGSPSPLNAADAPAGGSGGADEGTVIAGNWIGIHDAAGSAQANAVAVKLGDSLETTIGDVVLGQCNDQDHCTIDHSDGNVISGNATGVDQGSGTTSVWLLGGVFGLSPDRDTSVPNGQFNARLGGSNTFGGGAFVMGTTFGPAPLGLELVGPRAQVIASLFFTPDGSPARFDTAAIRIGPGGDFARIGSNLATPLGCLLVLVDYCNTIGGTGPGAPGIWVDGADDTTIWHNSIGAGLATPLQGPPIRVGGGAVGADIGDNDADGDPDRQNDLIRLDGPAIEVGGGATKIMIGNNTGLSVNAFKLPTGLFTDLLPDSGPGNSGTVNNGIQPPTITVSSVNGAGGTGIPGARVNVLLQEGPFDPKNPDGIQEGTTYPSSPSVTTVAADGIWGLTFPTPLKPGLKLLAAQTTADGSSEYVEPQAAQSESPPPVVTIHSGPTGVVGTRSATFTFSSNKPASRLQCSIDAAGFVPCSSPLALNELSIGGHQLQVRATDPTGKQGPPASRTWIVEVAQAPAPPPTAKTAAVRFTQVVSLPGASRCLSRRTLRITIKNPKGGPKVKTAQARIGGRKAKTRRGAGAITLSLKGLPRGNFVARVKVTLTDGRVVNGTRTYRTCAKKKAKRR